MKNTFATLIASILHIALYLVVRKFDIIQQELNVTVLWASLFATFLISLRAAHRATDPL
jgi:hypothetical protein